MEMEKINENTLRVKLEKEDLAERGISILDLIGNQHDAEQFFYNILDEVDVDHEFRDNGAVTFQLVPSGNGVELFITKITPEDAEKINLPEDAEFDDNNSVMLSNVSADDLDKMGLDQDVTNILKDRLTHVTKLSKVASDHQLKKNQLLKEKHDDNQQVNKEFHPQRIVKAIEFKTFDDFLHLAHEITSNYTSSLFEMNNKYYLVVSFADDEMTKGTIKDILSSIYEFGTPVDFAPLILQERGELIKAKNALEWAKYYF